MRGCRARSRAVLSAAACSHISISVPSRRSSRRRRTRGSARTDVGIQQARRIDARRAACAAAPLSRKPRSPASCSAYSGPKARANSAHQAVAFCGVEAQQPAIGEPHMIEPRFEVHRRREPGVARSASARAVRARRPAPPAVCARRHRHQFAAPATAASRRCGRGARRSAAASRGAGRSSAAATRSRGRLLRQVEVGEDQREAAHAGIVSDR